MNDSNIKLSKTLTYILRHKAEKYKLNIDEAGFINIDEILNLQQIKNKNCTLHDIEQIVKNCPKQRFLIKTENGITKIRANQGHTIRKIQNEELLELITDPNLLHMCVHGTYHDYINDIMKQGLKCMGRNNIHFVTCDTNKVQSGMRSDVEYMIYIDVEKAMNDGIKFYKSSNGVILSNGKGGNILPNYFKKIVKK